MSHTLQWRNHAELYPDGVHDATHGQRLGSVLWALEFGNATANGDPQTLFFTAGTQDEAHGLFGTITPAS